ncbi:MAG: aldo/keto reductase [bacterium]|nr:aldo/keto reductase [bacterium]
MTTCTLPGTALCLSAFCYGTAELGATVRGAAADRLINAFRDAGGNFLDTAHVYACWTDAGAGSSERAIAAANGMDYLLTWNCRHIDNEND